MPIPFARHWIRTALINASAAFLLAWMILELSIRTRGLSVQ